MVPKVQGTGKQYVTMPVAKGLKVKVDKKLWDGKKPEYIKDKAIYVMNLTNGLKVSLIDSGANSALTIEEGADTFEKTQFTNISGQDVQIVINAKNEKNDVINVSQGIKFAAAIDRNNDDYIIGNGCVTTADNTGY